MKTIPLFLALLALLAGSASAESQARVIKGGAAALPKGWADVGAASPDDTIKILLSLAPATADASERIKKHALACADPDDAAHYGAHLSMAEVNALRAPAPEALHRVLAFFAGQGIDASVVGGKGDTIVARGTVGNFAKTFSTTFRVVRRASDAQTKVRAKGDYVVPAEISDVVGAVFGMHGLPLPPRKRSRVESPGAAGGVATVTPTVLRHVYNITGVTPSGSTANRQAVGEFQGQSCHNEDLTAFFQKFVPAGAKNASDAKIYHVVGTNSQYARAGVEAALDVEFIMGVATGVLTEFWGFLDMDFCSDLKQFTATILSTPKPPSVFSISYGWQGDLSQIKCSPSEVADIDDAFASIAARGISVIFSSGDSGSGQTEVGPSQTCDSVTAGVEWGGPSTKLPADAASSCCHEAQSNGAAGYSFVKGGWFQKGQCYSFKSIAHGTTQNSKATSGTVPSYYTLFPEWPASSPWVTAVGATRFIGQDASGKSGEMATDQFGSGGGFSGLFNRSKAPWQSSDVAGYLKKDAGDLPPPTAWHQNGRGTPDVSAAGEGFQVIANGKILSVGGTSASAPTFAAIVSLLNEARLQAGKPAMGYLNPFIYKNANAFRDVTVGSNKINRGGGAFKYGWECKEGWDPATGHGTPIFPKLLQAALAA